LEKEVVKVNSPPVDKKPKEGKEKKKEKEKKV
jgi:hypothetical protein